MNAARVLLVAALVWPVAATSAPQIATYTDTSCAVVNGAAYCWGYNGNGQLGNGGTSPSVVPAPVTGLASGVSAITVGGAHACAVVNGGAWCWGYNNAGQLGNSGIVESHLPVAVAGLSSGVTAIAAGNNHSCAVVNGGAWCWGANFSYGQLGDNTTAETHVPVAVSGLTSGVVSITAGGDHSCAVLAGGTYCWGRNESGELGNNTTSITSRVPVAVTGFASGAGTVDAGGPFTCGVVGGGAACWGFGGQGQLGDNHTTGSPTPVNVVGMGAGVSTVSAGSSYHSCAVQNGAAYCWGYNNTGQLGNAMGGGGTTVPIAVNGLPTPVTQIAPGGLHTCAVAPGGVYCWGYNASGQLGIGGSPSQTNVPTLALAAPIGRTRTDFNNDGKSDILYRNNATGQIYRLLMNGLSVASGAIAYAEPNTAWKVIAEADFDGDNVADLLWRNTATGQLFVQPFAANGLPVGGAVFYTEANTAWKIVHTPDLDGDGRADLLWYNTSTGQVYAMLMNGAAIKAQGTVYTEPNTAWSIAAVGDFDAGGKTNQLLWRNSTTGQLFMMTVGYSGGVFSQMGSMIYQEPNTAWKVIGAPDLNGDGRSDILWRNDVTGQVYGMIMNSIVIASQAMVYSEPNLGAMAYTEPNTAWKVIADGDFNGDGVTDLLWRNTSDGRIFYQPFASNGLPNGGTIFYTEPNAAWKIVHTPDLDGDGKADLLWYNTSTGQVYVMLMNGGTIKAQAMVYTEPNLSWSIAAVGDFAGSGRTSQLLWRNSSTGQVYLQTLNFNPGFSQSGAMIYTEPNTAWRVIGAPDLDGDGRSDLLWRNDATGQVYGMLMNGGTIASQAMIYSEPNPAWKIVAQGDYNGDGKADLLYRNDSTGQVFMILMNGLATGSAAMVYSEPNTAWKVMGPWEYAQ